MANRTKKTALQSVPQTRDDVVAKIARIGDLHSQRDVIKAQHDERVREIGKSFDELAAPLNEELASLTAGVQAYCEAHRNELTNNGKVKFASFSTGTVSWRTRPPSVSLRRVEAIIEGCKLAGLEKFIRVKEEVNKDAMLAEPDQAMKVPGVTIKSGGEDFIIEPLELKKGAA
ncbi:host-nuclease inhibitor Gam family protein [Bartonella sp. B10834G6]|uniref:host-nuclease inhibitor Gam family protein n=1 Tax=Bartonella apis TaxID=1686310 RepID=UPI0018DD8C01|nr:host-nuclease inhibitor Gam family protein [Bartonella apis]MBH9981817.1 host-nuclease inhibitor Gam family protein [Bartonella apis]